MNFRDTDEGRMDNITSSQSYRDLKKAKQVEEIETSEFPPEISEKCRRDCISKFIKTTSPSSLEAFECGICKETEKR